MRRTDRQITEEASWALLAESEYGIVSTSSGEGIPYGVPVNFCLHHNRLYIHCALEGKKLDNIAANPHVSFCVVGKTEILKEKFSTRYESVICTGHAEIVTGQEKQEALLGLVEKYSPEFMEKGQEYIAKASDSTSVICLTIEKISGKARQ